MRITINSRVVSFFLIFMQSVGIRFFEGQGWVLVLVLSLLNIGNLKNIGIKYFRRFSIVIFLFLSLALFKSVDIQWAIYMCLMFFGTTLFLLNYREKFTLFFDDFYKFLTILFVYSLIHIPVFILFNSNLIIMDIKMNPRTFLYLFYYNKEEVFSYFLRVQGLAWEPGNWQLFMNIYFLMAVYRKDSLFKIGLIGVCVISTFSTNGFVLLILNVFNLIIKSKRKYITLPIIGIVSFMLFPLFFNNIQEKLVGEKKTSGLARTRDLLVGIALLKDSPFIGVDVLEIENSTIAKEVKDKYFFGAFDKQSYGGYRGFVEDGYINGFLSVFLLWGVFLGFLLYFLFYKSPLLIDKSFAIPFCMIAFLSFTAEPITPTAFFYLFPFSTILFGKRFFFKQYTKSCETKSIE